MLFKYCLAFLKHGSLWTYRLATYAVLIAGLAFVALVIGLRYLVLPNINDYREPISQAVSQAAGQRVSIGTITGSWRGYRPELQFAGVRVFDRQDQPVLALDRVETVLSWLSLLSAEVRFHSLEIYEPVLDVRRDAGGVTWVAGIALEQKRGSGGFTDWLLEQRQVVVRNARITWRDEVRAAPELVLEKVNLRLDNDADIHRFGITGSPPAEVASEIVVRGEFTGRSPHDLQAWRGRLYAEFAYANLALAQTWVAAPLDLGRGLGSLRVWLDLTGTGVSGATAELELANVRTRLAPELPELALANLQGRIVWRRQGNHTEISASSLGFTTAEGLTLAPMRLAYTRSLLNDGVRRSQLRLEHLDLAPVVELAEFLPLDPRLRAHLARSLPSGLIEEAQLTWDGDWDPGRPYLARAQFSRLALRADDALPGIRGFSGQFEATDQGGRLSLSARDGAVDLPRVFVAPVPIDFLSAEADWALHAGRTDVVLKNATLTNEHLAGSVHGSYQTGPQGRGSVDLTGTLVRADARQVWRYIPVSAPITQKWLQRALLAGESRDLRFRLKGPLEDFPFAGDKTGLFEVVAKTTGVTLDYADGWPPVTDVAAEVVFRGRRMEMRPQTGSLLGARLVNVQASIPELGNHDEHLVIKGSGEGPTPEFLRFVSSSPVSRYIGGFTDDMKAAGDARLDMELDLPLHRLSESRINGAITLRGNRVDVDPRLPALEDFSARIDFTRGSVNLKEGRARLFGNPISFEASNQKDGSIGLNLAGTLDMEKLRGSFKHPVLSALDGKADWRGNIGLRNRAATLRFESNLAGIGSTLPPPFGKQTGASVPLRVELRERPGRQSLVAVSLEKVVTAQLLLDANDPDGVQRGMISVGAAASLPVADGLWLNGSFDVVDLDVWRNLLGGETGSAPGDLAGVNLQIGILDANRRRFHDLKLEATRRDGAWQATLAGREIAGQVAWTPEGDGRLVARLSRLRLPPPTTGLKTAAESRVDGRLPSVDLNADSFVFEGKDLGRLSVVADPEASGWRLQRLQIINPDGNFNVHGSWVIGDISRTDVTMRLEVSDIGRFFARLGWPEGVKGGTAVLEGPVSWMGSPSRLDIPSLSGKLRLEASDGRFRQIEPGVAKLLGILSLQALPRRVSLDFKDVFSKGFTFDRISANLDISAGVANTEDFMMEGSAAKVGMRGQVNLAAETQNLNVRVTPSLTESIAVAGAIVNPAVGVAALIAQKALKDPLGQFASFEYTVTGTWADPVVARAAKPPAKSKGR